MPLDDTNREYTTETEAQRVLREAARIVRERWRQDDWGCAGEPRCAVGAIYEAMGIGDYDDRFGVTMPAEEKLKRHLNCYVPTWNDAPGRTAEEVAQALEAAAESSS